MTIMRLVVIVFSCLLLAAHLYRSGLIIPAGMVLALPLLLATRQRWARLTLRIALALASLEWLRTLYFLAAERIAFDQPWARMALILAGVAAFTAVASWLAATPAPRPAPGPANRQGRD